MMGKHSKTEHNKHHMEGDFRIAGVAKPEKIAKKAPKNAQKVQKKQRDQDRDAVTAADEMEERDVTSREEELALVNPQSSSLASSSNSNPRRAAATVSPGLATASQPIPPNLLPATYAYHVTNVPSTMQQPSWQKLQFSVASHTHFDGPLMFAGGVYFTTSFYEQDEEGNGELPNFSVYPLCEQEPGIGYWRVKVPLSRFDKYQISHCRETRGQVLLLLTIGDELTTRFRGHPDIDPLDMANNEYLCRRDNQWFANVFQVDGKFVNFFIPGDYWLGPGVVWDVVEHRGAPTTSTWTATRYSSATEHTNYWFKRHNP